MLGEQRLPTVDDTQSEANEKAGHVLAFLVDHELDAVCQGWEERV